MIFREKIGVRSVRFALAALAGSAFVIGAAQAQTSEPGKTEDKIQRVEVTGSNIKRIALEGVSPITVMTRDDIIRSGATSVLDVMRNLTSAGGNGGEFSSSSSFRNGATSVSLRGLPTLILLNGYRLPNSGSDEYSGSTSVDLNSIPLSAIERIDVLKDGASAIYGTDAVGGVINFILRKDYQGLNLDASYGRTSYNDGDVAKISVSGGFGDRATQNFNVTYAASYEDTKAIRAVDRPWTSNGDFSNKEGGLIFGGVYGNRGSDPGTLSLGGSQRMPDPECRADHIKPYPDAPEWFAAKNRNACFYAPGENINLVRPQTRYGAVMTANWDVLPNLSLFANVFYNHFETRVLGAPAWIQNASRSSVLTVAADNPFNTYGVPVKIRRLFPSDEGGAGTKVNTSWAVGGATGQIGTWDWTASLGHGTEQGDTRVYGSFMHDKLQQYLVEGKFNPFGGNHNSAQIINELRADQYTKTNSKTDFAKLIASTELGRLPGGPIGLALGAEYKRESLEYDPSQAWRDGAIGIYSVLRGISGSESLSAVFGEVNLPILKNLEAQAALRYDKYQLAGATTNPKLGLMWHPTETLMLRSSYSTGFRAPTLSQQFNGGRGGFSSAKDPKRCILGDVYFDASCDQSTLALLSGTKDLKPETSVQYNLGMVFEPVKNMSFGVTYWNIKWKDRIESLDNETVLAGENGAYKANVRRYDVTPEDITAYNDLSAADKAKLGPLVGRLKELGIGLINRSKVKTDGIDLDASMTFHPSGVGKIKVFSEASYTNNFERSLLPDDPAINCANNTACEVGEYGYPRLLAKLGVTWDHGPWSVTSIANYTAGYKVDRTPTLNNNSYYDQYASGLTVGSSTLIDASASYSGFKDMTLRAGINNVFNKDPSFDSSKALGYDETYGNPRGRYLYVSASYRFK
ncbi:TonB-dependent receptor [soil metagenome]